MLKKQKNLQHESYPVNLRCKRTASNLCWEIFKPLVWFFKMQPRHKHIKIFRLWNIATTMKRIIKNLVWSSLTLWIKLVFKETNEYIRKLLRSSLLILTYSWSSPSCFHRAEVSSPSFSTSVIFLCSCNERRSLDSVFFSTYSMRLD